LPTSDKSLFLATVATQRTTFGPMTATTASIPATEDEVKLAIRTCEGESFMWHLLAAILHYLHDDLHFPAWENELAKSA
jgi:hypothetical protein